MHRMSSSKYLETDFILRDKFAGGYYLPDGTVDYELKKKVRTEYANNILDNDYTLCVSGSGNFSYRLYETLSCGRIPLFVDTDSPLPYDFIIDWKKYCVWIDQTEVNRIDEIVRKFHEQISPDAFIEMQRACRRLWLDYLSPEGFYANFYRHFQI